MANVNFPGYLGLHQGNLFYLSHFEVAGKLTGSSIGQSAIESLLGVAKFVVELLEQESLLHLSLKDPKGPSVTW